MKTDLRKYKDKNATIYKITLLENGDFVEYYSVRISKTIFSNKNGAWKFDTKQEAMAARKQIKEIVKREIAKLEGN